MLLLKSDEIASRSIPWSDFAHGFHRLLSSDGTLRPRTSRSRRAVTAIPLCPNVLPPLDAAALPKHLLVCAFGRKADTKVQVVRCIASIVPEHAPVSLPVLIRRFASNYTQEASLRRQCRLIICAAELNLIYESVTVHLSCHARNPHDRPRLNSIKTVESQKRDRRLRRLSVSLFST